MEIGKIHELKVHQITENNYCLINEENEEVLMPKTNLANSMKAGDLIAVFVYRDEGGDLVATTEKPRVLMDQFAFLKVTQIKNGNAYVDWGLPFDLIIPFEEQSEKMKEENWVPIFLLVDEDSGRLIGSNRVDDFVFFDEIDVKSGDEVELLLYRLSDLGMNAIVNNLYKGLIFSSDIHKNIYPGDRIKGFVKSVREDGKIDLLLEPLGYKKSVTVNSDIIMEAIKANNGFIELNDKSSPEEIKQILGLSKKAFKKGLGNLYKSRKVEIYNDGIKLL